MKTKMPKAMYGKSMMKKGGSKKSLPKAQMGKAVSGTPSYAKSQSKAEKLYDSDPSVRTYTNELTGKSIPTGPMTKEEYQSAAERAASKRAKALGAGPTMKKGGAMKKMQKGGVSEKSNTYLEKPKPFSTKSAKIGLAASIGSIAGAIAGMASQRRKDKIAAGELVGKEKRMANKAERQANPSKLKQAAIKIKEAIKNKKTNSLEEKKKGGAIKKMKTGGMNNPNSSVYQQTVPGSRGVQSGVNPKASSSKVAGSRGSGNANTPPSKAVPTAKRGGAVKKKK